MNKPTSYLSFTLLTCCLGLSACGTKEKASPSMTKEECQRANWSSLGYTDAFKGRLVNKFSQREEECAKFEVKASPEDYQKGFELGKIELCKPPSALDLGLKGVPNIISQCPQDFISSAKEAYEKGLKVYNANSELDKILKSIKTIETKMKILGKNPIKLPSELDRKSTRLNSSHRL